MYWKEAVVARWVILILVSISLLISCAQITLTQVGKLRMGMTIEESQKVTAVSPKYTIPLGTIEGNGTIAVHSYILTSGNYKSNYFLAYRNGGLIYWGYPHEFARSKDLLLNEIGQKAVIRLEQLKSK